MANSLDRLDLIKLSIILMTVSPRWSMSSAGDVNVDHRRLHGAVVTACSLYQVILFSASLFEVASSTSGNRLAQLLLFGELVRRCSEQWQLKREAGYQRDASLAPRSFS